jgi:homoserine O-succinyltransferase
MYLCWGAMAGLYYLHGVRKRMLGSKLFGVFEQRLCDEYNFLTNGFDEVHNMPHSRHATVDAKAIVRDPSLEVLSQSVTTGPALVATRDLAEVYVLGHFEYGRDTLATEYWRDFHAGLSIQLPENYFPGNNPEAQPLFTWRAHANLLWRNWLNFVYQTTPYDLDELEELVKARTAARDSMAKDAVPSKF